jgi:hypothetical protein
MNSCRVDGSFLFKDLVASVQAVFGWKYDRMGTNIPR